jgi:DNA-binding HxlR family transcriptional regulator
MRWSELEDETCSVARTVSVIGDRWTLLILRDCFLKVRRFDAFQERLGVARPILADRLDKLVKNFVLTKVAYQERPTRYEYRLTPKGMDLYPVILSMVCWGDVHLAGKDGRPVLHRHLLCQHEFDPVLVCSECGEELKPRDVEVLPGPGAGDRRHLPPAPEAGRRARKARTAAPA